MHAIALATAMSVAVGCEPPTIQNKQVPPTSALVGRWTLDYGGKRLLDPATGKSVDGAGVETLDLAEGGDCTQSFRGLAGDEHGPARGSWRVVEDERRGPLLVLSGMVDFSRGAASVQSGRQPAHEVELILLPSSPLPFGEPTGWQLCYPSADLELCFSRVP